MKISSGFVNNLTKNETMRYRIMKVCSNLEDHAIKPYAVVVSLHLGRDVIRNRFDTG